MRPVGRDVFNDLNKPLPSSEEPEMPYVGTYDMARMISKKTKFRVLDVKEVLDEVGPCIYGILLQRKSVRFGGIYLRSAWTRFRFPKFVRFEGPNDDNGYWTYGYLKPKIEMDKQYQLLYSGERGYFPDKFIETIMPYVPDGITNIDDVLQYSISMMEETCQLGKNLVIDEDGYTIPMPPRRKKYKFDPGFHPTWLELIRYKKLKRRLFAEYHARKDTDDPMPLAEVFHRLYTSHIFDKYRKDVSNDMVMPSSGEEEDG